LIFQELQNVATVATFPKFLESGVTSPVIIR
jgi:hypothetical protein